MAWGQCDKFCCSDVCKHRDPFPTKLPNLTNPIHPILQRAAFDPDIDYSALEVPLRLASKYLTLSNVVHNICVLIDGTQTVHTDSAGKHIIRHATPEHSPSPKHSDDYTSYNHWRANEILRGAIGKTHFHILPNEDRDGKSIPRLGSFIPALPLHQRGFPCDVYIGGYMYHQILALQPQLASSNNLSGKGKALAELLYCHFELARLIIHELAHSLRSLYTGVRRWEHHSCSAHRLSEGGYDIEACIFGGGLVNACWSKGILFARENEFCTQAQRRPKPQLATVLFYNWPSFTWLDMYRSRRYKMGAIDLDKIAWTVVENVAFAFVEDVMQDEYWRMNESRAARETLTIPRMGKKWGVRWSRAGDEIQPWMSLAEKKSRKAANEPAS